MSTITTLKQAPADTLELLVARPELAVVFWMDPNYQPKPQPAWVRWLARTLGGYTPPMELPEAPPELHRQGERHQLATGLQGLAWFKNSGRPVVGSDHGYGDERAASPDEVAALDALLKETETTGDLTELIADTSQQDDLQHGLGRLREYIAETVEQSFGLVIKIS